MVNTEVAEESFVGSLRHSELSQKRTVKHWKASMCCGLVHGTVGCVPFHVMPLKIVNVL